jgi:hypothetical protein
VLLLLLSLRDNNDKNDKKKGKKRGKKRGLRYWIPIGMLRAFRLFKDSKVLEEAEDYLRFRAEVGKYIFIVRTGKGNVITGILRGSDRTIVQGGAITIELLENRHRSQGH